MLMLIQTKRVYDLPDDSDGTRVLIDRLWPRGLSKQVAKLDYWAKDCAPSTELRKWYNHDPSKWNGFRRRYFDELDNSPSALQGLKKHLCTGTVTLLFGSKEVNLNNATAFKEYLESNGYGA